MIPFPQNVPAASDGGSLARSLPAALPRTYAVVFYSTDVRFGWALLGLSLLVPQVGLAGLSGVLLAAVAAWALGLDRALIRSGFLLFNPLLSCSALMLMAINSGWSYSGTALVLVAASLGSMMLTSGLQGWITSRMGLSVQSLPSVVITALLHHVGMAALGSGWSLPEPLWTQVELRWMPEFLRAFFHAFSAMAFQSSDLVGVMIYVAFVLSSPIGGMMATLGYAVAALTLHLLGLPVDVAGTSWCGFNFLLAGVALGAGYHVPNRSSLLLAAAASAMTALVAVALGMLLGKIGLTPGALPYNLVVLTTMASLRLSVNPAGLLASPWTTLQPEGLARLVQINRLRFPDYHKPALFLPCAGELVVTQGFDGPLTHQGPWRHALDFESPEGAGSWDLGDGSLHAFGIFGRAVHAPMDGSVVAVERLVPDNLPGRNNPESNWGNHVILRSDFGHHVMLSHFLCDSIVVEPGQRVKAGAFLGSCGNSGRSPVPHLHVHVQHGPHVGAPTLPFVMKHYVESGPAGTSPGYRLSGVPSAGTVIRPAVPSPALHGCFTGWLPGRYHYDSGDSTEVVRLDFDESGRFRFESPARRERLSLHLSEGVLYASPFEGHSGGVLSLISIVLARVPCIEDPAVIWQDVVPAAPFLDGGRRLFHDVLDPFLNVAVLPYRYAVASVADGFLITAELEESKWQDRDTPKKLIAEIRGRHAVVSLHGETCGGREIRVRLARYEFA